MSPRALLPPGLLDLTLLRVFTQNVRRGSTAPVSRKMHQAVLASLPPTVHPPSDPRSRDYRRRREPQYAMSVRRQDSAEEPSDVLVRRVDALANLAVDQSQPQPPDVMSEFSEDDLLAFYENVLALPVKELEPQPARTTSLEMDQSIVDNLALTLVASSATPKPHRGAFSTLLNRREGSRETRAHASTSSDVDLDTLPPYQQVIVRLQQIVPDLEAAQRRLAPIIGETAAQKPEVLFALVSNEEWNALVRNCLAHKDFSQAEMALEMMKRTGALSVEEAVNDIMGSYATNGDVSGIELFMEKHLTNDPTHRQRHLHVKAHELSCPPGSVPTSALAILHQYENQSLPAPMTTYTRLIRCLFETQSSLAQAQAWDLFAHMRYVAHPEPDALLYTLMIRACSPPSGGSEPERALDLFTELTVDRHMEPTEGAYSAVILACARSGTKAYVNEAFRLAKQMLDSHRDAHGRSAFRPEGRTFSALLEGAKRIGDLARVRWILAELVKATRGNGGSEDAVNAVIDDSIMMHVFHAYAAYRPPFRRAIAPLVGRDSTPATPDPALQEQASPAPSKDQTPPTVLSVDPSFKHLPPQSRAEVIDEAQALFSRILTDALSQGDSLHDVSAARAPFQDVQFSSRLLNSYLSVHYSHAPLDVSQGLFRTLHGEHRAEKNDHTYIEALERCARPRALGDKGVALSFAEEVWAEWSALESAGQLPSGRPLSARMIERAHAAMIRVLTLTDRPHRALAHLRAFVARYPPSAVRAPTQIPSMRSMRTVLAGDRPLVRLTSALEVPDDKVPPLIGFADLEILHHRLVVLRNTEAIAYVKYVCHAYEGALRSRRNATLHARDSGISAHNTALLAHT